ncbi:MAG TPA: efflux RND transporter periplasmic adaptor subunit [Thiolapillus brandeum]|uniref:Efflux RND transporter periplasmic adaptor subunit n=1 Tax=Thiolapillus brandeum TaxID=1076588 RepID=A0A831W729_9GAMM|nr:efflux RND transporter periplasmic adaptor subunit [Thiolapillus brandeum]
MKFRTAILASGWLFLSLLSISAQAGLETGMAREIMIPRVFRLDGVIEAVNKSTISAQTNGQVEAIYYDVDDVVKQGALLVKLKDTEQQAALRRAEADLRAAQAVLDDARKNYRRIKDLYTKKLVSKSDLDDAQVSLNTARAKLDVAKAALEQAREQLAYTRITAPYTGIVTERHVQVGEVAHPGTPLMSGISLQELRVAVDVPQSLIVAIREKSRAQVELPGGKWIEVSDLTVFPFADPSSNTFKVRLQLPKNIDRLFPGMLVKTAFETGVAPALIVPASAVVYRSEVTGLYVRDEDQQIRFRYVRLGDPLGEEALTVLSGLQEGDEVFLDPIAAGAELKRQRRKAGESQADE